MKKVPFYENMWFINLLVIIAVVIYFAGVFYFASKGAKLEQCLGWPIPWLFIGSIVLMPIKLLVEKILEK